MTAKKENYIELPKQEQQEILQYAANQLKKSAHILEKDIWICYVLKILFSLPDSSYMAFKGGTSLSKVFNVINRFSEDIDITLDYKFLNEGKDPLQTKISGNQINKLSDQLKKSVKNYANKNILLYLQQHLKKCKFEISEDGEKISVIYPSVVEATNDYVKSQVLVELGGRNVITPSECHVIKPDVMDIVPEVDFFFSNAVFVLSPERTFWEKVTLIHVECNRTNFRETPERLSRHWYDLFMLSDHPIGQSAIKNYALLEDVVKLKKVFFNASYANYDGCLKGKLRLLPIDQKVLTSIEADYKKMVVAKMIDFQPPTFDDIKSRLMKMEQDINKSRASLF